MKKLSKQNALLLKAYKLGQESISYMRVENTGHVNKNELEKLLVKLGLKVPKLSSK